MPEIREEMDMKYRLFEIQDAKRVLSWISSEKEFRQWSADRYGEYPIEPGEMVLNYMHSISSDGMFPLTFLEKGSVVGHLTLRYPSDDMELVRLGFIIVNKRKRGKGYGTKMIYEAMKFAVKYMDAKKFDLVVFTNNENAYKCYERIGFKPKKLLKNKYDFHGEKWDMQIMEYDPREKIVGMIKDRIINPLTKAVS